MTARRAVCMRIKSIIRGFVTCVAYSCLHLTWTDCPTINCLRSLELCWLFRYHHILFVAKPQRVAHQKLTVAKHTCVHLHCSATWSEKQEVTRRWRKLITNQFVNNKMDAIMNFAAILENGYFYSFSKSYIYVHWPPKTYISTPHMWIYVLYNFLAKNVRHFGFGPLAASSTNCIVLDFWYVVEEVMSFHLVYNLLLLQFVLGYPPF